MPEKEVPPDDLRCRRTDGKQWRCSRPVIDGKKMCEIHHQQLNLRQHKQKVPDSLKLVRTVTKKRKSKKSTHEDGDGDRDKDTSIVETSIAAEIRAKKKSRVITESEVGEETVRQIKLNKGDLDLDLIAMVLKRESEKKKHREEEKKKKNGDGKNNRNSNAKKSKKRNFNDREEDVMRVLPNGVMAISSSASSSHSDSNAVTCCDVKIGGESYALARRPIRSKNVEPVPIGPSKVVPRGNAGSLRKESRKRCHWCGKKGFKSLIGCSNCQNRFFCLDCIEDRKFHLREVAMLCPVCRKLCNCKVCQDTEHVVDVEYEDNKKVDRVLHFHYLLCMLLPVLKQINSDRSSELQREATIKGQNPLELQVQPVDNSCNKQCCCSNCKTPIVDLHKSCPRCSYNLCLRCYRDSVEGSSSTSNRLITKWPKRRKALVPRARLLEDQSRSIYNQGHGSKYLRPHNGISGIPCPPKKFGGCGEGFLDLRCVYPLGWIEKLEKYTEEIVGSYQLPETLDTFSCCSICFEEDSEIKQSKEAARRKDSKDNFLYHPTVLNICGDSLEHFQKHWSQGHPVIVQDVLKSTSNLSWDPIAMFCEHLKSSADKSQDDELQKPGRCLDWFEVDIGVLQKFSGSLGGRKEANMCSEKLKLKGWLSSHLFQEHFSAHCAEIINALPLPHYMDCKSGFMNIAADLPDDIPKPDLGPCVYISHSSGEEVADSVMQLCFDSSDVVNILMHATDAAVSTKQICSIRKLLNKLKGEDDLINKGIDLLHMEDNKVRSEGKPPRRRKGKGCALATSDSEETESDSDLEPLSPTYIPNTITNGKGEFNGEDRDSSIFFAKESVAESCGAQWDVFRRQDVPKLLIYLRKYANKFRNVQGFPEHVVHPMLEQNFFLDATHKMRLKEEFGIEPWTFQQHIGEAVIIPAGCPYQIRKFKSCVNVVLNFLSPESVPESIQITDELRLTRRDHEAKPNKLEVKKMAIHSISSAIKQIRELTAGS